MEESLRMNYISLLISILLIFFMGLMYFLLGKSMAFPMKICYAVIALVAFILIIFNIIMIIRKLSIKI
ncbi:hypothetical protein [Clostridium pasteurianum]|uniref:Uncharacterized protein n=1 Tax=Clostridium pasteurianum BC1 TaxID=86416 RepID=R4K167_CLOPA|nr:hypothetical protein [Clostridium pasteurianum]AGK96842.1 hypothetical protein Clopa_1947 [Clostridium pasteurianum BC1]